MAQTFRIYGPEIGKAASIVDLDVTGVTTDGAVELTPTGGGETITLEPETLSELADINLAYDASDVDDTAPIWQAIQAVETQYENATGDNFNFVEAAKTLFQGAN